jgi:hypothetical protein
MAAVWTACTKLIVLAGKKWSPGKVRGFAVLWEFLRGVLEKVGVSGWFFVVIFVVEVWWERGFWMVFLRS